ncbi:MAG: hypothetical protein A2Y77_01020 [Planctomycetes bacterium RBG_13_62_9]|nr:MAG: hypothetical protein A2Y77_01020 [Planctomycetes bacterium RBG_13_62_9]
MTESKPAATNHRLKHEASSFVRNLSLKHKLVAIIMLTCITALALASAVFIAWEWTTLRHTLVQDLSAHGEILADNCKAAITFHDPADASGVLKTAGAIPAIVAAYVYTQDGELFAAYTRQGTPAVLPPPPRELQGRPTFQEGCVTLDRPIVLDGQRIGVIRLKATLAPMYARLERSIVVIVCILLLSSIAAYLISSRLQQIISSPILYLAGVANAISEKQQYTFRVEQSGDDEVGLLMRAFNEMLGQIQRRDARLVEANEQLEARVTERTVELTAANEHLMQEIGFRKQTEQILVQRTERIIDHQRALLRLTKNANSDLPSMMRKTTEEAARTLAVERVGIWFLRDKASELLCEELYSLSLGTRKSGSCLKAVDCPSYFEAIENDRILAIDDIRQDARTESFRRSYLEPLGITSMMVVPIRLHAKLLGVACYEHIGPARRWLPEEQDFAASVSDMIALQVETNERRKLERALANANEHLAESVRDLRRSNKELQDFAYVAAHDLKAPLRGIGTLADWIASDYADQFDEQGRQQLRLLKGRVTRLAELINGILHYSEIGRLASRQETVDLNKLVPEIIALLDPPAHIQVVIDGPLPTLVCEKVRLGQVFHNLIDNAIKYLDKPQGRVEINCTEQGRFWEFAVRDSGPGIEEKYFEKIFQMFQTLAPRDQRESTGIGLPIVKKIVELFGGKVWVESKPGEGATFLFTLPKQEAVIEKETLAVAGRA